MSDVIEQQTIRGVEPPPRPHDRRLEPVERTGLTTQASRASSPMQLVQFAVESGRDLAYVEKLLELAERHDANQARKAHNEAFASFKSEAVTIIKGKIIKDGPLKGKSHADLFDVVNAVSPALAKHGLSINWKLTKDEKDWLEVTCYLKHAAGHVEVVSMGGAPDTGPGRNAIQARCSTKTYLERYTATAILGMAATDADDDGAGGAGESDPLEAWAGRVALTQNLDALGKVAKEGAKHFRGANNADAYRTFVLTVQERGLSLRAAEAAGSGARA